MLRIRTDKGSANSVAARHQLRAPVRAKDKPDDRRRHAVSSAAPAHHARGGRNSMLGNGELVSRLVLAAALGSVIGFERERLSWAAGLRTHMLVCVGSTQIMIVSTFGFADVPGTAHICSIHRGSQRRPRNPVGGCVRP
jgi:hypothetical protein